MKSLFYFVFSLLFLFHSQLNAQSIYRKDNIVAWCVVPFDSVNRTPAQRIQLLQELGISQYAYDWRARHLPTMANEWELAEKNGISVKAVWCWIDNNSDKPGKLSSDNEAVFQALKLTGLKTQLWVGFNDNFFENLSEEEKIDRGVNMLRFLHSEANKLDCRIALYNHGSWFGEPENQIKIIEASGLKDVGIIYNFHHAHSQLDRYREIVDAALPWLWAVNLNGMKQEGPQILPLGTGDLELAMMKYLKETGYKGSIGVLGHVENADVAVILRQNLNGLQQLLSQMGDSEALSSFK